jgi:hypothetical protein
VALLALADLALVDGRGELQYPVAVRDDPDEQLRCLVLRLLQQDRSGDIRAHGPQAERRVADALAGQQAHQQREEPDAGLADRVPRLLAAHPPGAGHEIGLPGDHRGEERLDLGRVVLAVGVGANDVVRAALAGDPVSQAQRRPLATVDRYVADDGVRAVGLLGGGVGAAVGHHDDLGRHPAHDARKRLDNWPYGAFLVVGGDHQGDRRQLGDPLAVAGPHDLQRVIVDPHISRAGVRAGGFPVRSAGRWLHQAVTPLGSNSGHTVARPVSRSIVGW